MFYLLVGLVPCYPACRLLPTFVNRGFLFTLLLPPHPVFLWSGFFHSSSCPSSPHSLGPHHARTRNGKSVGGTREGKDAAGGVLRALPYAEHRPPIREPHEGGRRAHEKPSSEKNASHDRGGTNGSSTAGGPRAAHDYPGVDECGERTTRPRTRGATATGATWHAEGAGSPHSSCGRPSRSNYAGGARATDDDPGVDASEGRRANTRDRRVTTM